MMATQQTRKQHHKSPSVDVLSVYRTMDEMHEVSLRVHHLVVWKVMNEVVGDGAGGHGMHTGDTCGGVETRQLQTGSNSDGDDRVVFACQGVIAEDTGGHVGEACAGSGGSAVE